MPDQGSSSPGYDIGVSTSISASPQGSAGGGNVFNAAPLFGSLFGQTGGSYGDSSASTPGGNAAAAAKGSSAQAAPDMSAAGNATTTATPATPATWYIAAGLLGVSALVAGFVFLRRKKKKT